MHGRSAEAIVEPQDREGAGIAREEIAGRPQDPTGTDPHSTSPAPGPQQESPKGAEGKEGGAAGKFTGDHRKSSTPP
jgi:hypothetical protein